MLDVVMMIGKSLEPKWLRHSSLSCLSLPSSCISCLSPCVFSLHACVFYMYQGSGPIFVASSSSPPPCFAGVWIEPVEMDAQLTSLLVSAYVSQRCIDKLAAIGSSLPIDAESSMFARVPAGCRRGGPRPSWVGAPVAGGSCAPGFCPGVCSSNLFV